MPTCHGLAEQRGARTVRGDSPARLVPANVCAVGRVASAETLAPVFAVVEDRVKTLKNCGASHLPFGAFAANAAWLELALTAHDILVHTQQLVLDDEHKICEPKRLRYRILHVAGHLTCQPTGPGPARSCAPSSACTRCQPTAERLGDASDDHDETRRLKRGYKRARKRPSSAPTRTLAALAAPARASRRRDSRSTIDFHFEPEVTRVLLTNRG